MPSPGEDVQAWSTTASSNSNADPLINWAEGQPRASVNNSARSQMAAHAKNRNLQNGSITTGGSANAQTFTSGVGYTTVPTGLVVLLKIGATNTTAATLEMDGLGAVAIKDTFDAELRGGELVIGGYAEFRYDGTNWILLHRISTSGATGGSGLFRYVSPTALSFKPFNGSVVRINGVFYDIPSTGIVGLGNTGVFVNGTGGLNLAASTLYNVAVFNNGGTLTADFINGFGHSPSTTAGNLGTEIVGSDTRTLIGLVYTDPSAQFTDVSINRGVIGWFNRRPISLQGTSTSGASTSSTTPTNIAGVPGNILTFVKWADDDILVGINGFAYNTAANSTVGANVAIDNTPCIVTPPQGHTSFGGSYVPLCSSSMISAAEGGHVLTPQGFVGSGAAGYYVSVHAFIRG